MTDITDDVIDGVPYYAVVCALVWMCQKYLERDDGRINHQFMSAGEAACTILERLGLLVDDRLIDNSDDEFWLQSRLRQRERQAVAVPGGMMLVPIEPTEEMIEVGREIILKGSINPLPRHIYKSMLRAAPDCPHPIVEELTKE
jgi:hypothetical protein